MSDKDSMSDLVARLLNTAEDAETDTSKALRDYPEALREAADAIEALSAILRACEGRVRVKPLVWEQARDGAGWHPQLTIAYCPVFDKRFYAEHPEKQAKIDAAREARILSALEPAPDHETWNAAIEAAAYECDEYSKDHGAGMFDKHSAACADRIRQLKKGQTND